MNDTRAIVAHHTRCQPFRSPPGLYGRNCSSCCGFSYTGCVYVCVCVCVCVCVYVYVCVCVYVCVKPGHPRQRSILQPNFATGLFRLHEAIKIHQIKTGCFGNEEVDSDYGLIRIFKLAASSLLREVCLVVHKLVDYLPSHGKKVLTRDPELVTQHMHALP